MNKVIKIEGLDCANCARELEEELNKLDGVSATVDFMAQKVHVDCDVSLLAKVKDCCNNFEEVSVVEGGEKLKISGLCCANCARELEEELNKLDGVSATVDFMNMNVVLNAETGEAREKAVYAITHFEDVKIIDGKEKKRGVFKAHLKEIIRIIVSVVFFIPALVLDYTLEEAKIAAYILYGAAYLAAGYPVLLNTVKNIAKGKIFDENFLMAIASLGAIALGIFGGEIGRASCRERV